MGDLTHISKILPGVMLTLEVRRRYERALFTDLNKAHDAGLVYGVDLAQRLIDVGKGAETLCPECELGRFRHVPECGIAAEVERDMQEAET